jgi:hypothetical protein
MQITIPTERRLLKSLPAGNSVRASFPAFLLRCRPQLPQHPVIFFFAAASQIALKSIITSLWQCKKIFTSFKQNFKIVFKMGKTSLRSINAKGSALV